MPLTALVTGGNRGLGLEICRIILEEPGSHVFLGCRDLEVGRSAAATLDANGGRVEALCIDVSSKACISCAAAAIARSVDHLDLLVNNAGILHEESSEWSARNAAETFRVNLDGVVSVTAAVMPLLVAAPAGATVISTTSGMGARALGLLSEEHRSILSSPSLTLPSLRELLLGIFDELGRDPNHPYHAIPTVAYSLSKLGVNCYTQILARAMPTFRVNACSPGFTNTGMCAGYTGPRTPKDVRLGASVFRSVLFSELGVDEGGRKRTATFFKEASKPGTPLESAVSVVDPWLQ